MNLIKISENKNSHTHYMKHKC